MKKPLPETRLTHERIGSKVMRDDPMTPMTQTKEQVSEKARELVTTAIARAEDAANALDDPERHLRRNRFANQAEDALLDYIASLEADSKRLDWLDDRENFRSITPATNMIGVPLGWTFYRTGQSYDAIGQRCADIREAIDARSTEEVSR